jgi:Holliday junction resolvase
MSIQKSTRHSRIIGEFGERLLLNWLSRSGFEVCVVDHTGIDVVAYHPKTKKRLGITVKSRTRSPGTETVDVTVLSYGKALSDRDKLMEACKAFACEPWIAVYIETVDRANLYLTSLEHFEKQYKTKKAQATIDVWKMGQKHTEMYETDPEVRHIEMRFCTTKWSWCD